MRIIIKETIIDSTIVLEPLFVYNDCSAYQTSLGTIIENMKNLLSDEQQSMIKFISLYAGNFKFKDCPPKYGQNAMNDISFLLKVVKGHAQSILKVSDCDYELKESSDLLNKENTDSDRSYQVFSVRGKLTDE